MLPLLQAFLMGLDEITHHKRGLGRWERWSHPLDTLLLAAALLVTLCVPWSQGARNVYIVVSLVSCLSIAKDEAVHARSCGAFEHWLHALLFMLHPVTLIGVALAWRRGEAQVWRWAYLGGVLGFAAYQTIYWNGMVSRWNRRSTND